MNVRMVAVASPRDEATASIIRIVLEDAGIPVEIRSFHSAVFDGIFTPSEGAWGQVLVPAEELERAKAVLEEYGQRKKDGTEEE